MSNADDLPDESSVASQHSRPPSAFPALASVVDHYRDHDTFSASAMSIAIDKFLVELREDSRWVEEIDTKLAGVGRSQEQEIPGLRGKYYTELALGMERYGRSCNLANHIIRHLEGSNIPPVWNDPKDIEGACKSKCNPDIIDSSDGRVSILNGRLKNYNERISPVNGGACQRDEGGSEGWDGKGKEKDGNDSNIYSGDSSTLPVPTLGLKAGIGSVDGKCEDCLPEVCLVEEIDDLLTNSLKRRTLFSNEMFKAANRICRAIAMDRLVPLGYVKSVDHFKQAMRSVVLAHHVLFTSKSQILHHHISVNNLMVRYNKDGTACGVLIDFDLAAKLTEVAGDHTGTRTGTRPFMAWQLLESDPPPIHLERFDWESFFYVICWIGCRYSEGKEVNKSALSHWYSPDEATLMSIKQDWLSAPEVRRGFTPFYVSLFQDWIEPLQAIIYAGRKARGSAILNEVFDEVTLGGCVTWDRFWGILQN